MRGQVQVLMLARIPSRHATIPFYGMHTILSQFHHALAGICLHVPSPANLLPFSTGKAGREKDISGSASQNVNAQVDT